MKVTEKTIQAVLMRWAMAHNMECAVPNTVEVFHWEADLITVTKAGLLHEFEIKISASDYKADKKKFVKHWNLENGLRSNGPAYFWYVTHGFDIEPPEYAGWIKIVECGPEQIGMIRVAVQKPAPRLHKGKITDRQRAQIIRSLSWRLVTEYDKLLRQEAKLALPTEANQLV